MSLRLRLVVTIGLSVAVLWAGAAAWMLRDLDRSLQETLDGRLAMSARMVAGLVEQSGHAGASLVPVEGTLSVPGARGMACQVRSLRGEVVATTGGPGQQALSVARPGYHTTLVEGQAWRTYTLRTEGFDITTADRLDERTGLRRRIALAAGVPFLIAAVGGLLALWFGTGRALAPLASLQQRLARRNPDATDPVDGGNLPAELRPLIGALNGLLARMADAIQRERGFTNDAAHELRTPLTVIDTHLQVARMTSGESASDALRDAATGVERLRGTLEQLLMLARIEGRLPFAEGERIDAADAVARAVEVAGSDAHRVVVDAAVEGTTLDVPPQLAVVALRNIIGNALRYSPAGSQVVASARREPGAVRFVVTDEGPGMSEEARQSATRRFWRGMESGSGSGSGLGLTLVDAIADRFGGSLALQPRSPNGLAVKLVLPARAAQTGTKRAR